MSGPEPSPAAGSPAPVFAALGDPTRLSLLARLSDGRPRAIAELASATRISRQAVTKHLHVLAQAGLVDQARVGRETRFAYRPGPIDEAARYLQEVSAQWDAALARLKRFVEGGGGAD